MNPILNVALRAARRAGDLVAKRYETPKNIPPHYEGSNVLITNIDKVSEKIIVETIRKYYPKHTIISEERYVYKGIDNHFQWIIDPLDGTVNFIKRLPHFAVSIAVCIKGRTEVAVVYDPLQNELFTAIRGQGAQLNGYRLRGSDAKGLEGTILATAFPFNEKQCSVTYMNIVSKLFNNKADLRNTGSSALDLSYVAAGRVDGFFKIGLKLCDFAAGGLIACEAGALICDFVGSHNYTTNGNIVAGTPKIVKAILANIRAKHTDLEMLNFIN